MYCTYIYIDFPIYAIIIHLYNTSYVTYRMSYIYNIAYNV